MVPSGRLSKRKLCSNCIETFTFLVALFSQTDISRFSLEHPGPVHLWRIPGEYNVVVINRVRCEVCFASSYATSSPVMKSKYCRMILQQIPTLCKQKVSRAMQRMITFRLELPSLSRYSIQPGRCNARRSMTASAFLGLDWLPDHERLRVVVPFRKLFTLDQCVHCRGGPETKLLVKRQGVGCSLKKCFDALIIRTITAILEQFAASAFSLELWRCPDDFKICRCMSEPRW